MTDPHAPFPRPVQHQALERQKGRCASCRTTITELGHAGAHQHMFSEGVEAVMSWPAPGAFEGTPRILAIRQGHGVLP